MRYARILLPTWQRKSLHKPIPLVKEILGVVAVLIPKFPLLKEWAYAGFFFAMSRAVFSHIALGDSVNEIFPSLLLLILTLVSWYFRPADRKIISVHQYSHGQDFRPPKAATEKHGNHGAVGA